MNYLKALALPVSSFVLLGTIQAAPDVFPSALPVATIPLEPYLRSQTIVHAVVDGQVGTFLFDTGAGVSTISPDFVKRVGCRPWGQISGFRMSGERLTMPHCNQLNFNLAGQSCLAPAVGVFDIMKLLGPDLPPIDGSLGLDIFAGRVLTIIPRKALIIESPGSLARRVAGERELPLRLVRDVEGLALAVDAAVPTSEGMAWMELDTGNGGANVIANHIAPLVGLKPDTATPQTVRFELGNGIFVEGTARTRDLIMDGNISAQFLNFWTLTLDLQQSRAWLTKLPGD